MGVFCKTIRFVALFRMPQIFRFVSPVRGLNLKFIEHFDG
jgi:hypothetical protein